MLILKNIEIRVTHHLKGISKTAFIVLVLKICFMNLLKKSIGCVQNINSLLKISIKEI